MPANENLAIRLHNQGHSHIVRAEGGRNLAIAAEGQVQAAGREGRNQPAGGAGIVTLHKKKVAIKVHIVGQHAGQGEGRVFIGDEAGARVVHRHGRVVDAGDSDADGGAIAQHAVGSEVGEGVGNDLAGRQPIELAIWVVIEGAIAVVC